MIPELISKRVTEQPCLAEFSRALSETLEAQLREGRQVAAREGTKRCYGAEEKHLEAVLCLHRSQGHIPTTLLMGCHWVWVLGRITSSPISGTLRDSSIHTKD